MTEDSPEAIRNDQQWRLEQVRTAPDDIDRSFLIARFTEADAALTTALHLLDGGQMALGMALSEKEHAKRQREEAQALVKELEAENDQLRGTIHRMDDEQGISDLNRRVDGYIERVADLTTERDEALARVKELEAMAGVHDYRSDGDRYLPCSQCGKVLK